MLFQLIDMHIFIWIHWYAINKRYQLANKNKKEIKIELVHSVWKLTSKLINALNEWIDKNLFGRYLWWILLIECEVLYFNPDYYSHIKEGNNFKTIFKNYYYSSSV
jgi:hypothetical protein